MIKVLKARVLMFVCVGDSMLKFKNAKKLLALLLPVCVIACSLGGFIGIFTDNENVSIGSVEAASYDSYYAGLNDNLTGLSFRTELADLITDTHDYNPSYDDLRNIFDESDADPNRNGNIIWFYTGTSVSFDGSFNSGTNREHVWPKNGGGAFPETSDAGSDAHHLRPTNANLNSSRGNNNFGEVPQTTANIVAENGSKSYANLCYQANSVFYPGEGFRGATARILMYVQTRWGDKYNLSFVLGKGSNKTIGDIEDLLKWHIEEPPTEAEKARNEVVYGIQGNRNPFIDHPEYAEMIYCNDGKSYNDELQAVVQQYGSYLNGGSTGGGSGSTTIEPTSVTLSQSSLDLIAGGKVTLTASVQPTGASQSVIWTSSNPSVATVSGGVVTAVGAGTTTITASSASNSQIKASATVSVKAITALEVSGSPLKTQYTAGDIFNPSGINVTATYSDGSTISVNSEDCAWLDGTKKTETLAEGSTSIICKYGNIEKVINGITVKAATTQTLTITRDNFTGSGAYSWCDWTVGNISGQGFMYPGHSGTIQMNSGKASQYIFNSTALSGGIVSVTIKASAEKQWNIWTSTTPYGAVSGSPTAGTKQGTLTSTTDGATLNIGTTDQYFAIDYASTGVIYIEEIVIVFGSTHAHTPGEWIVDKDATCSEKGYKYNVCSECEEIVEVVEIPMLSHTYGTWTQTTAPTCTTDGEEQSLCSVCKEIQTRTIERLGHELEEVEGSYIAPTCKTEGYESTYKCTREGCNHSEVGDPIPTLDHTFGDWVVTDGGKEERTCSSCGHTEERNQANLEVIEQFEELVEKVDSVVSVRAKWDAIGDALDAYDKLSESEKEASSTAYAKLIEEINSYNAVVDSINTESEKATEQAIVFYIGAISVLVYAAYFLLKA